MTLERFVIKPRRRSHLAPILRPIPIRRQKLRIHIHREHAIRIRIGVLRIPDRHAPARLAPVVDQTLQQIDDLRGVEARHRFLALRAVHAQVLEKLAVFHVLLRCADGAPPVGFAHDHFAGRGAATLVVHVFVHHRLELLDYAAVAVAVQVALAAVHPPAAEGAAFAVDAYPFIGLDVREHTGGEEEQDVEEDGGTHVGGAGGVVVAVVLIVGVDFVEERERKGTSRADRSCFS